LLLNGPQTLVPFTNVSVGNSPLMTESEMTIAINPTNPLNVAGFAHNVSNLNQIQVFSTTDGGTTWSRTIISNVGSVNNDGQGAGTRFDPTI
jgi:hypothetical protein